MVGGAYIVNSFNYFTEILNNTFNITNSNVTTTNVASNIYVGSQASPKNIKFTEVSGNTFNIIKSTMNANLASIILYHSGSIIKQNSLNIKDTKVTKGNILNLRTTSDLKNPTLSFDTIEENKITLEYVTQQAGKFENISLSNTIKTTLKKGDK